MRLISDVSFDVHAGEIVGVIGETGSGKTLTALSVLNLLPHDLEIASGEIIFEGVNITRLPERALREIRGRGISLVFQDAGSALNPVYSIGHQLRMAIKASSPHLTKKKVVQRALDLLTWVGIPNPKSRLRLLPSQLSGGMKQRVLIAQALSGQPKVLIADEPTASLDASIRAEILDLLDRIVRETDLAIVLITHDLSILSQRCDQIVVMYAGQVVERGATRDILDQASHPYAKSLVGIGTGDLDPGVLRRGIPGVPPQPKEYTASCRFFERCRHAVADCQSPQELLPITQGGQHCVRCVRAQRGTLPPEAIESVVIRERR